MPIINSNYNPRGAFKNYHFSTIYSAKFRPTPKVLQQRERLTLKDGDFLDLDFSYSKRKTSKIAILLHGLEGNSQRTYIKGQAKILVHNNWDVCAINFRGCSGDSNLLFQSYHAGRTEDLKEVVHFLLEKNIYKEISLIGFSLGGNLLLKYLGENSQVPEQVSCGIAISSPLQLNESIKELDSRNNWLYHKVFMYSLKKKYKEKIGQFPEEGTVTDLKKIKKLQDLDNIYTAPSNGFIDAHDYYTKCSSLQFLPTIKVPVLILNAQNDLFLSPDCYPVSIAEKSKSIYLETAKYGGHVGFYKTNKLYYSEERSLDFLNSIT